MIDHSLAEIWIFHQNAAQSTAQSSFLPSSSGWLCPEPVLSNLLPKVRFSQDANQQKSDPVLSLWYPGL